MRHSFFKKNIWASALIFPLFSYCNKKSSDLPVSNVFEVVGKAIATAPNHDVKDLYSGMSVPMRSNITVAPASLILLGPSNSASVMAAENTVFSIDSIIGSGPQTTLSIRLFDGKLFCFVPSRVKMESMPIPVYVHSIDRTTTLFLRSEKDRQLCILKTLGGSASVAVSDRRPEVVPACCKALVNGNGRISRTLPLNDKDFVELEIIAGKTTADSVIAAAACPQTMPIEQNLPPQWKKTPANECAAGKAFFDTLVAKDPEGSPVSYRLIDGPKGMSIDAQTGVLRFYPKKAATYSLQVAASDATNPSSNMTYSLSVINAPHRFPSKKFNAIINAPAAAAPHEPVAIDASQSATFKDPLRCLSFRFDVNGDGRWDYPPSGGFGKQPSITHAFDTEGIYFISAQVKNTRGQTSLAKNRIVVRTKPIARIVVSPQPIIVNKECVLDASHSSVSKPNGSFEVRWDLDNNGTWDVPPHGGYTSDKIAKKTWPAAGTYSVVLEIRDNFGAQAWADAEIDVASDVPSKTPLPTPASPRKEFHDTAAVAVLNSPPVAHAGNDILSKKGRSVTLKGSGENPYGRIVLYEWDFNNDGVYEASSRKNGIAKHAFKEYSYAVLRVTDEKGAIAKDTARVVICPGGMVGVEGPFCVDEYEWPNKKGSVPEREMTYDEARKKCSKAGKHLCTSKEWKKACAGDRNRQYPKSNAPSTQNCNVIGNRSFSNKVAPSGSFPDCKSPVNAFDMNGNVAEWTSEESNDGAFVYGGSWHNDLADASCSSKVLLKKNKGYFYVGFRCCK